MPLVAFPLGSFFASTNWMFGFPANPFQGSGIVVASAFFAA
jgi:hypothetical protein